MSVARASETWIWYECGLWRDPEELNVTGPALALGGSEYGGRTCLLKVVIHHNACPCNSQRLRCCVTQEDIAMVEVITCTMFGRRCCSLARRLARHSRGRSWRSSRTTSGVRSTSPPPSAPPSPLSSTSPTHRSRCGSRTEEPSGGQWWVIN